MTLILDLIGPPRLMGARNRFELRSGSATVGRSPEADWVIPDHDRMISRRHLRIDLNGGDFVLTDTSANGVYVNGSDVPVGYGASARLRHGDRLRVGEAEIAVAVEAEPAAPAAWPPADRSRDPLRDPLGGPFAASAGSMPPGEAPGGRTEIIDANWMIQPEPQPLQPARDPVPPPRPQAYGGQAYGAQAPGSVASLSDLVGQRPQLSALQLAELVDAAAAMMEPAERRSLYENISRSVRP